MDNIYLYILILTHVIICIVYILVFFRKSKMNKYLFTVIVFFPYIWIIFFIFGYIFVYLIMRSKKFDKSGLIMQEEGAFFDGGQKIEANIIPVEEALILNDNDIKRDTVIEIAKRDPSKYLEKLKGALLSNDSETAHYAASSISKLKRNIDKNLRDLKINYEQNSSNTTSRREYIDMLDFAIKSKLNVDVITNNLIKEIITVLRHHITISKRKREVYYNMLIDYLLTLEDSDSALYWTDQYCMAFNSTEGPLVKKLKIAFLLNDIENFNSTINEIENAKFPISNKTLEMIEFWRSEL